jgi:thiamine-monophosphate kinase
LNEHDLIARFLRPFATGSSSPAERGRVGVYARVARVALGPGDDGALLRPSLGQLLCVTTDAVREGVHFGPLFRPHEIGHKALAVNLSDLAAMGARPRWFTVAIEVEAGVEPSRLDGIARGMARLAALHRCALVGGNVVRGDALALTLCAMGEVRPGRALRRDGLRPGDLIAVSGDLGSAALGLRLLKQGIRRGARAQLQPEPRVALGRAAGDLASAAIDVSDGLAQDLGHMLRQSGCGAELWADALPTSAAVRRRGNWLSLCLQGGEDYELCLGVPPSRWERLRRRATDLGTKLTVIGEAQRRGGLRLALSRGQRARPLVAKGFSHF